MLTALAAATALIYMIASGLHISALVSASPKGPKAASLSSLLAAFMHFTLVILILVQDGVGTLLGIGGGVLAGGLILVGVYLLLAWRLKLSSLGSLVMPVAALSVLPPLLNLLAVSTTVVSILLVVHVASAIIGTVFFTLAFVLAVLYIAQQRQLKLKKFGPWLRRLPSLGRLDQFGLRIAVIGFAFYTLSIVLGMARAWQQLDLHLDARNMMASLTWFIYALMIQGRITTGWRGRKAALLTIVGSMCALGVLAVYFLRV